MSLENRLARLGIKYSNDIHSSGHVRYNTLNYLLKRIIVPFEWIECDNEEKCTILVLSNLDFLLNYASLLLCKSTDMALIQGNCTIEQSVSFFDRILDLIETEPLREEDVVKFEKFIHVMVEKHEVQPSKMNLFPPEIQIHISPIQASLDDLEDHIKKLKGSIESIESKIPQYYKFEPSMSLEFQESLSNFVKAIQLFNSIYEKELAPQLQPMDDKMYGIGTKAKELYPKVAELKEFADNIAQINHSIQYLCRSNPSIDLNPEIFAIFEKNASSLSKL